MTIPADNPLAYQGVKAPNPPNLVLAQRAPTTQDVNHDLGSFWLNEVTSTMYVLVTLAAGVATWESFGGGSAGVDTINGLSPAAGNITLAGTASQITAGSAASTVTFSLPAAIVAPGSLTTTTTLEATTTVTGGTGVIATTGDIEAVAGDIVATAGAVSAGTTVTGGTGVVATTGDVTATAGNLVATVGNVQLPGPGAHVEVEGGAATDFIGTATLTAGTVTIAHTTITAADRVMVTRSDPSTSTALGVLEAVVTPSTNIVINARNPADATIQTNDVSVVSYYIVRQL